MIKSVINKIKCWSNNGIKFWYAYDSVTEQKSITLFFTYITFWLSVAGSVLVYFNTELIIASINSMVFWLISFVMYRIRRIDTFKFDLDDTSFEISGNQDAEKS